MSATRPVELTVKVTEDMEPFFETCKAVFNIDMNRQTPPVPEYKETYVMQSAKLPDGRTAAAIVVKVLCNAMEVMLLASNPDCTVPGAEAALLKWAEESARGEYACNQIFLSDFSWRPRSFYEAHGFALMWEQANFPKGYTRYFVEKKWSLEEACAASVQGYDDAAADVHIEEMERTEWGPVLREWSEEARKRVTGEAVGPFSRTTVAVQGFLPDGTLATQSFFTATWNTLFVHILVVLPDCQRGGVGSVMLAKLDELARQHGCDDVCLDTMSWQARPFYEKNGFIHVATQEDVPMGFKRYHMLHHVPQEASSAP